MRSRYSYPGWKVLGWFFLVTFVVGGGIWATTYYSTFIATDCVLANAQIAAKPEDMQTYLQQYLSSLRARGMDHGYASLIPTPYSDMTVRVKAIEGAVERLNGVIAMEENSTEYQTALDDIRGILRETPNPAGGWTFAHQGWIWLLIWLITGIPAYIGFVRP